MGRKRLPDIVALGEQTHGCDNPACYWGKKHVAHVGNCYDPNIWPMYHAYHTNHTEEQEKEHG